VGTKWIEGCYCLPDAALKSALELQIANYRHVLIDSPAGLEHLNRRITSTIDDLFDIIGPSSKSFAHVERAVRIIREVHIRVNHFHVVASYLFPENLAKDAEKRVNRKVLGQIQSDPTLAAYVLSGKPLTSLPEPSPAYESVKNIMKKAGY